MRDVLRQGGRRAAERHDADLPPLAAPNEQPAVFEVDVFERERAELAVADPGDDEDLDDRTVAEIGRRASLAAIDRAFRFVLAEQNRE